jgi:hypothetical protein
MILILSLGNSAKEIQEKSWRLGIGKRWIAKGKSKTKVPRIQHEVTPPKLQKTRVQN